jgi:hypothetical protein
MTDKTAAQVQILSTRGYQQVVLVYSEFKRAARALFIDVASDGVERAKHGARCYLSTDRCWCRPMGPRVPTGGLLKVSHYSTNVGTGELLQVC